MTIEIQIRLADSGHSQKVSLQNSAKGETLINKIENMYKISPRDQILITKIGHIIEPHEFLDKAFTKQMQDKTLVASSFKEASHNKSEAVFCVFLFNLKQLNKPDDILEERSKNYWAGQLKEKLFQLNDKSAFFPNQQELQKKLSSEQLVKYQKFISKINSLKESYRNLTSEYSDLKDSSFKIQRILQRCSVQKKSGNILMKSFKGKADHLLEKLKEVTGIKDKLKSKFQIDDKSLRENSGFFEIKKKNENSAALYEGEVAILKDKLSSYLRKVKQQTRTYKSKFRDADEKQLKFGKQNYKQRILQINSNNKNDYEEMMAFFVQFVQSGASPQSKNGMAFEAKLARLQENITKVLLPQYERMCQELTNSFCEANQIIEINKLSIKQIFHWRNKVISEFEKYLNQLHLIQNTIRSQINKQQMRKVSISANENVELSQKKIPENMSLIKKQSRDQVQFERRVKFIKALNFIQSFATKMCFQEECQRKKYVNDLKNNKCEFECLKNAKVRQIDFDDNNSSDLEIMKLLKVSKSYENVETEFSTLEFMLFNYNWILQKIKSVNINQTNIKIKNMQEALKKMTDVFCNVYNKKIDDILNQKLQIASKAVELQEEINKIQLSLDNSKAQTLQLHKRLVEKQELLISRQKQRSEQINKQRRRYEKLSSDFKELQRKLNKQVQATEELYNQVLRSDQQLKNSTQLNQYLKELLAQKEVQIIEIQKKLSETQINKVEIIKPQMFKQNDLKSVVLNDFGKDIIQDPLKQKEVQRLNQQIALLQKQNQQLQQQFDSLESQLRKIITKQTEDIETQVNFLEQSSKNNHISINQDISIGQNAIFMPFSNHFYVGVNHKDDNKTVCNVNNVQPNQYLLDLSSFNLKTRELLSQCSFLVILRVNSMFRDGRNLMVKGQIKYLFGFQDDNLTIKNYSSMLPA